MREEKYSLLIEIEYHLYANISVSMCEYFAAKNGISQRVSERLKNQHELPTILPLSYLAAFELHNIRLGMHVGNSQPTDFLGFELSFATDIECKYHHMQQKYS